MANIVTLHKRQFNLADGSVAQYARAYFRLNHTETQLSVFSDPGCAAEFERSQPVICDVYGVLPPCYLVSSAAYRVLATDENDVQLPSYPQDDITPEPTDVSAADTIPFTPTDDVPATTVQEAIEYVAGQVSDINSASTIVWPTAGTGNAYTITPTPAIVSYDTGQAFWIRPDRTNTGASTINVNGLGTRALRKTGPAGAAVDLVANELFEHREAYIAYDGSVFRILAGQDDVIASSNVSGKWRLNNGQLTCTATLEVPFSAISNLGYTWTFPRAFSSPPDYVGFTITGGAAATALAAAAASNVSAVPIQDFQPPIVGPRSTTSLTVRIYRANTSISYATPDKIWGVAIAIGPGD